MSNSHHHQLHTPPHSSPPKSPFRSKQQKIKLKVADRPKPEVSLPRNPADPSTLPSPQLSACDQAFNYLQSVFSGAHFISPFGDTHRIPNFPLPEFHRFKTLLDTSHDAHYESVRYDYSSPLCRLTLYMPGIIHEHILNELSYLLTSKLIALVPPPLCEAPPYRVLRRLGITHQGATGLTGGEDGQSEFCADQSWARVRGGKEYPNVLLEVATSQGREDVSGKLEEMVEAGSGELRFAWGVKVYEGKRVDLIAWEYPNVGVPPLVGEDQDQDSGLVESDDSDSDSDEEEEESDSDSDVSDTDLANIPIVALTQVFNQKIIEPNGTRNHGTFPIPLRHFFHPHPIPTVFPAGVSNIEFSFSEIAKIVREARRKAKQCFAKSREAKERKREKRERRRRKEAVRLGVRVRRAR